MWSVRRHRHHELPHDVHSTFTPASLAFTEQTTLREILGHDDDNRSAVGLFGTKKRDLLYFLQRQYHKFFGRHFLFSVLRILKKRKGYI